MEKKRVLRRTTILLDAEAEAAVRELATKYGSTTSEAIRRSITKSCEAEIGLSETHRQRRTSTLHHLIELFDGHDVSEEIRSLKDEDDGL